MKDGILCSRGLAQGWNRLPLLLTSFALISLLSVQESNAAGVQSGPATGNTYAGGMVFDANNGFLYVTGATYEESVRNDLGVVADQSSCFMLALDIEGGETGWGWDWDDGALFGSPNILESCQALGYLAPSTLIVGGNSEPGGLYASPAKTMSAFAMLLDKAEVSELIDGVTLSASSNSKIPYPQFIVTNNKDAYIISLTSTDDTLSTAATQALETVDSPNWIFTQKYGGSFDMSVRKVSLRQEEFLGVPEGPITLEERWIQEFPTVDSGGLPSRVYIGGVIAKTSYPTIPALVVAGSTRALGQAYGEAEGDDEDGFVALLDMENGNLIDSKRFGTAEDDVVTGICDAPNDSDSFYIVGATKGDMYLDDYQGFKNLPPVAGSLSAFISKIDINTLKPIWTQQFGALNGENLAGAYATGCVVSGNKVYVAGGVQGGAEMILGPDVTLSSKGGDDIWVAQLQVPTGTVNWMEQDGTPEDDNLSRNGGVTVDSEGNVVLYGDTKGSLYRTRDASEDPDVVDVFVMILDAKDGAHADVGAPVAPPTDAPAAPVFPIGGFPTAPTPHSFVPIGTQIEGPLFAGGMVYDARNNRALLTGSSFDQQNFAKCYFSSVDLDNGSLFDPEDYGLPLTNEACSAISFSQLENLAYLVGGTQAEGFMLNQPARDPKDLNQDTVQYGLVLQVGADDGILAGGGVNEQDVVQYPVAIVNHPTEDAIFVASLASDSAEKNFVPIQEERPNYTTNGGFEFGKEFFLAIQKYSVIQSIGGGGGDRVVQTVDESFYQWYGVDGDESVMVSGMVLAGNGNTLVVVGSTRGSGGPFGTNNGGDMDGFVLKLDPNTGELQSENGQRSSTRLDSINGKDDTVFSVCNDRFDQDAFYVVGSSEGKVRDLSDFEQPPEGTTHGFIAKVQLESLTAEWLKHFTMRPGTNNPLAQGAAYGCSVVNQGEGNNLVYVAGVVEDGATMDGADVTPGAAGDDIFVAQLNGADGSINWIHQVGTAGDERLAKGGPIDVDDDGNAIVYAETNGNFYRNRIATAPDDQQDLVVFTLNKIDGSYKPLTDPLAPPAPPTSSPTLASLGADGLPVLPDNVAAIQSGPDRGPTYAGGMHYDEFTNSIYVTGATYGAFSFPGFAGDKSNCFFASVTLPRLEWNERQTYGETDVSEACNAVALTTFDGKSSAVAVGSSEEGGLLSQLGSGNQVQQYGFALDLASVDGRFKLQGGGVMDETGVQFPIAVTTDDKGNTWIASMTSKDTKISADFDKTSTREFPNFTIGGIEKYGSNYQILVEKFKLSRSSSGDTDGLLENSLQPVWRKPFETADKGSVYVSQMIHTPGDTLVVLGSTQGKSNRNDDMDGIMAKIDGGDGSFESDGRRSRSVAYLSSASNRDDWILGGCADPDDAGVFYIVGATQGKLDRKADRRNNDITVHAMVAKIELDSLSAIWTKQFPVTHADGVDTKQAAASAFGCDVIKGAGAMYIAGVVENGATIDFGTQTSAGRDDIFVGKLLTKDGYPQWIQQVGSNGDDRIARGGGVKVDANGNAVVFGETNGSFFRDRSLDGANAHYSNLFMMIFDKDDGAHVPPIQAPPLPKLPEDTSTPFEWYPNGLRNGFEFFKFLLAVVTIGIMLFVIFFFYMSRRQARKQAEDQTSSIFAHLQQFDVEDIDLRKSPPGGWHVTYLNKLAYGINKVDGGGRSPGGDAYNGYETAPLTHSSVVRDSLFMDNSATPSLGYKDKFDKLKGKFAIGGLDTGYDDLAPRTKEYQAKNLKEII